MELQEQDIALLEAYLAGELEGDALRACEERLRSEPALAETLAMMMDMEGATAQTARAGMKQDMKAAKTAAIAAGMADYTPAINPPKTGGSFLGKLFKLLFKLGILAGIGWVVWKYVLHEKWPPQLGETSSARSDTTTTTKTTITYDTIHSTHRVPVGNGQ
jgi:hypothetical protein